MMLTLAVWAASGTFSFLISCLSSSKHGGDVYVTSASEVLRDQDFLKDTVSIPYLKAVALRFSPSCAPRVAGSTPGHIPRLDRQRRSLSAMVQRHRRLWHGGSSCVELANLTISSLAHLTEWTPEIGSPRCCRMPLINSAAHAVREIDLGAERRIALRAVAFMGECKHARAVYASVRLYRGLLLELWLRNRR